MSSVSIAGDPFLAQPPDKTEVRFDRAISLFLFFGTFALFARAIRFDFVNLDDATYVYRNPMLHGVGLAEQLHWAVSSFYASNYHPVTLLGEILIARTLGTSAAAFHCCNIVLHSCCVTLVYGLLSRSTGRQYLSAWVAVLWGWHPLRVESVVWVSELKDGLSTFFWLSALLVYVRFTRSGKATDYLLLVVLDVLACGSKPMAVALPFTVLLLDFWPLQRLRAGWRRIAAETLPLFPVSAGYAFATWWAQRSAAQFLNVIPLSARIENAAFSTAAYIGATFFPLRLAAFYPHPTLLHHAISLWWIPSAAGVILMCVLSVKALTRAPYLLFGWGWFLITLVPVIGLVQVGEQARADRYTYIPAIGLTVIVVWSISHLTRHFLGSRGRVIAHLAAVSATVCLIVATRFQISYWKNTRTLFERALAVTQENTVAMDLVALEDIHTLQPEPALPLAHGAYVLRPGSGFSNTVLGEVYDRLGLYSKSVSAYKRAVTIYPTDADLHNDLAAALSKCGRPADAVKEYHRAIELQPDLAKAHHNLGMLLAAQGDVRGASEQWRLATKYDPSYADDYADLARAEEISGDGQNAESDYHAALAQSAHPPADWLLAHAWLVATSPQSSAEQVDRAVDEASRAIGSLGTAAAGNAIAYDTLAAALARQGRYDDAIAAANAALAAHPPANLATMIHQRLDRYRAGRPFFRETGAGN